LNLPRYIDSSEPADTQDLSAHLYGGIPNNDIDDLAAYWEVMPSLRKSLFEPYNREGYSLLKVSPDQVLQTIYNDPEYKKFIERADKAFGAWLAEFSNVFSELEIGSKPKLIIEKLAESLLESSSKLPLLDPYSIYQALMSYWSSTLQDDAFLIAAVGWLEAAQLHTVVDASDGFDAVAGKTKLRSDLLPASVLVDHYLPKERDALAAVELENASQLAALDALIEENSGEDGLMNEVLTDAGNVNKKQLSTRIREIRGNADFAEELMLLESCSEIVQNFDNTNKRIKAIRSEINEQLLEKYRDLTEAEVKKLSLEKWKSALVDSVETDRSRIGRLLTNRISALGERYDKTLSTLESAEKTYSMAVMTHLKSMGLAK